MQFLHEDRRGKEEKYYSVHFCFECKSVVAHWGCMRKYNTKQKQNIEHSMSINTEEIYIGPIVFN